MLCNRKNAAADVTRRAAVKKKTSVMKYDSRDIDKTLNEAKELLKRIEKALNYDNIPMETCTGSVTESCKAFNQKRKQAPQSK